MGSEMCIRDRNKFEDITADINSKKLFFRVLVNKVHESTLNVLENMILNDLLTTFDDY